MTRVEEEQNENILNPYHHTTQNQGQGHFKVMGLGQRTCISA